MDLERLDEALEKYERTGSAYGNVQLLAAAARAYRDLANGERVEPDYEAAARVRQQALVERAAQKGIDGILPWDEIRDEETRQLRLEEARRDVDAAIGDKLLIDPPVEED